MSDIDFDEMEDDLSRSEDGESDESDSIGEESRSRENIDDSAQQDFDWEDIKDGGGRLPSRFNFIARPGPRFSVEDESDVLQFFELFFDQPLVNLIVGATNQRHDQRASSSCGQWKAIQRNEMMLFLAIEILQGLVRKPTSQLYWSTAEIWKTPIFPKLMPRDRYIQIKTNLYFADDEAFDGETHPCPTLWKFWPIHDDLSRKFSTLYVPTRELTIDESLIRYKGRWLPLMPRKTARRGIRIFSLCETKTAYMYSSLIYTGKGSNINDKYGKKPLGFQVVATLMEPLLNKGYCLVTDSFYTSPTVAQFLVEHNTDTYGSLKRDIPKVLAAKALPTGAAVGVRCGKINIIKWRRKQTVCFLSTVHTTKTSVKQTKLKSPRPDTVAHVPAPQVAADYYASMRGVGLLDKDVEPYNIGKKKIPKYYHKLFYYYVEMCICNAHILYRSRGGKLPQLTFRSRLVERIIERYHNDAQLYRQPPSKLAAPLRLTERHFAALVPPTARKVAATRRCVVCSSKTNSQGMRIRKETRYMCDVCDVGLCAAPCFKTYHTQERFP